MVTASLWPNERVPRPKSLPAELAAGSFTIAEGRSSGISPWRAKAKDIHVPSRGIRIPAGADQSLLQRARPYTRLGTPDTVSFYSAALIHAFRLPRALPDAGSTQPAGLLHLTRAGSAAPRRKGVVGHRSLLDPADIVIVQGVPVTSIPRTLLDLAGTGTLTLEDLVVIADDLVCEHVRHHHPRTARLTLGELLQYTARQRPVAGLRLLRASLGHTSASALMRPRKPGSPCYSSVPACRTLNPTSYCWTNKAVHCGSIWHARNTGLRWSTTAVITSRPGNRSQTLCETIARPTRGGDSWS